MMLKQPRTAGSLARDPLVRVLRVVVCIPTCRRPDYLATLLERAAVLQQPADAELVFLVLDNDPKASARALTERHAQGFADLRYVLEPKAGIPVVRNRALAEARALDADLVCFIDDDEYPDRFWLTRLLETYRRTGARLVGGPVLVAPCERSLGWWKKFLNLSLAARAERKAARTASAAFSGGRYTVVTNNWLADLAWLDANGLSFNETDFLFSGGSDTAFFRDLVKAGGDHAWAPDAIVHETILPSRLSLRYQLRRARAQSANHFFMRRKHLSPLLVGQTILIATTRAILGLLLLLVPIYGIGSLTIAVRSIGWSIGRIDALFGLRSTHYR